MAAVNDAASDIHKDPNFAVICSFIERYGELLELPQLSFSDLQRYIEDTRSVNRNLQELLLKLLRRWKRSFTVEKWQRHLVKFAFFCSDVDGWELEKFGFPRCKLSTKLRIIKNLLEVQFDTNTKFKEKINEKSSQELRFSPLGRDKNGLAYWYLIDKEFNLRIYREEQDDVEAETWEMVVSDRNSLVGLIGRLVQEQNKSRSATPSSQDGENSQDGSLPLKVEPCDLKATETTETVKLKAESENLKVTREEVKKESIAVKSETAGVKPEKDTCVRLSTEEIIKLEHCEVKLEKIKNDHDDCDRRQGKVQEDSGVSEDKTTADGITDIQIKTELCENADDVDQMAMPENQREDDGVTSEKRLEGSDKEVDGKKCETDKESAVEKEMVEDAEKIDDRNENDEKIAREEVSQERTELNDTSIADDTFRDGEKDGEGKKVEGMESEGGMEADGDGKGETKSGKELESPADVPHDEEELKTDKPPEDYKVGGKEDIEGKVEVKEGDQQSSRESFKECKDKIEEEVSEDAKKVCNKQNEKDLDSDTEKESKSETQPKNESTSEADIKSDKESDKEEEKLSETETNRESEIGAGAICEEKVSEETTTAVDETEIKETSEPEELEEKADAHAVERSGQSMGEESHESSNKEGDPRAADKAEDDGQLSKDQKEASKVESAAVKAEEEENKEEVEKSDDTLSPAKDWETVTDKTAAANKENKVEETSTDKGVLHSDVSRSKRKRTRDDEKKEQADKSDVESNDESEISDSQTDPGSDANSDEPPSKKKRDKMLKKASSRTRGRQIPKGDDSMEELSTSEQSPPAKKQQRDEEKSDDKATIKTAEDKTESNTVNNEEVDEKSQSGSDKENVKKRGRGTGVIKEEASDYEPSSKKGRPAVGGSGRGRGRGRGRPRGVGVGRNVACQQEAEDSDDVPLIQLRRSTRSNKGQRVIEPLYTLDEPRRKQSRKAQEQEQQRLKKQMESASKSAKKDKKKDKKKKKKDKYDSDEDFIPGKNGYKKRHRRKNVSNSDESDEDDDDDLFEEEEDVSSLHFSSSSSEVEVDCDSEEYQPTGRNAKRAAALCNKKAEVEPELVDDDASCCKCGKGNHPELILLCDRCDSGYHTACLRPPLMIIPDGDWFCPPCEHLKLIENLQNQLKDLDTQMKAKERLVKRKERLAYVGISLDNILPEHGEKDDQVEEDIVETARQKRRERHKRQREREYYPWEIESQYKMTRGYREYSDSDSQASESPSQSESDEEEESTPEEEHWLVMRRSRRERKEISYKFDEYDNIINSAIKEQVQDLEATEEAEQVEENVQQNSGKEGSNPSSAAEQAMIPSVKITRKPRSGGKDMSNIPGFQEEEEQDGRPPPVVRKRKKGRRLTALDSDAAEEGDDSEEYKASDDTLISDYEDEIPSEDSVSDDWMIEHCRKSRRSSRGTRRSRRKRGRRKWDDDFVVDNDYESEDDDSCYRRTRRCVSRRQVSYREDSGSDSQGSGYTSHRSRKAPQSRHKRVIVADSGDEEDDGSSKWRSRAKSYRDDSCSDGQVGSYKSRRSQNVSQSQHKRVIVADSGDDEDNGGRRRSGRKKYSDDSEYTPSDNSECSEHTRKTSSRKLNYRDMIGSDSEEIEEAEPAKKKKGGLLDMNDFLKSSSEGSATDSSGSSFVTKPGFNEKLNGDDLLKSDRAGTKKINGLPKDGSDIEAVLTDTSKLVSAVVGSQAEPLDDVSLDDDLEDVDDLVSYVTQE